MATAASRASRIRRRISYREPSSDDDDDEDVLALSPVRPTPASSARKRKRLNPPQDSLPQPRRSTARPHKATSYKEPSSDEDPAEDTESDGPPPSPRRRGSHGLLSASPEVATKLRRLPPTSYQLPSSDTLLELRDDGDDNGESVQEGSRPLRPRRATASRMQSSQTAARLRREPAPTIEEVSSEDHSDAQTSEEDRAAKRRGKRTRLPRRITRSTAKRIGHPRARRAKHIEGKSPQAKAPIPLESDGVIPPWASLPYEVLLQIFTYACYPLHDDDFNATSTIAWLLQAARICKTFVEPALTALYRSPPLVSIDKPHKLTELLADTASARVINYNVKIRRLEFDVIRTLAYTYPGKGQFELADLIPHVPQLTELSIVHPQDRPPFRPYSRSGRWHYSQSLFAALQESSIRLKAWTWNSNLCSADQTHLWMGSIHQLDAFQRLEHVSLLNYSPKPETLVEGERTSRQILADNLVLLSRLKSLSFESCQILDAEFLPLLKEGLESLTITNCHNVTSEILQSFLVSHGSHMKELVLNHNQSLDISFLPDLRRACPRLEVLRMDLNYYDSHASFRDSDPKYVDLLKEEETPRWPTTLQTLEMVQLRKWTSGAAESFFASLLDSADELPDLRRLVLKAILNIGWRDRAGFRDQWIGRLQRVFLRKSTSPDPNLMSGKRFRMWKDSFLPITPESGDRPKSAKRLSHVQITPKDARAAHNTDDDGDSGPARHLRPRRRAATSDDNSDEHETSEEGNVDEKHWRNIKEKHIQGMCEVVDIRIDNLRPREEQFNENDFLDSEVSGDEDWNGEDDIPGNEGYAW
ncbi:uncharacterized protein K452DRAFT_263597 [Aplosporella prunicola CBS 121167]|uniref:Uncharacterized protein n=1 Tax=Aplosporella prunicola CBS 121167 TaxID=1176127 RepID=A0A6A6BQ09_9PEZI|nr:uncharacterized protein K452DRAFT_263597 [Aplosporella prunicola CBS 121167]KAF2146070.1 hypothetical protein K452DRAFT_263597 [Aplosporella prunicola CBS 121167]